MSNVFISYNRRDEAIAKILADDIKVLGHTVWFDQELSGGQIWWAHILATVRDCDVFIFALSPESLNSTACKREYGYAADLGKTILPIMVADGVSANLLPPALSLIQLLDYRGQDRNAALGLARAFTTLPPSKPLPDPLPTPPEVPISYLGTLSEQIETAASLSYEQQSAIVFDIRRALRDPETANDARLLLEKLRKRRDLLATIAEEIDELRASTQKSPSRPRSIEETQRPQKAETSQHTDAQSKASTLYQVTSWNERFLSTLLGATAGSLFWMIYSLVIWGFLSTGSHLIIVGTAGAITGAICGMQRNLIRAAIAGAIVGFIVWLIADLMINGDRNSGMLRSAVLGTPIGAILGAIAGRVVKARKESM